MTQPTSPFPGAIHEIPEAVLNGVSDSAFSTGYLHDAPFATYLLDRETIRAVFLLSRKEARTVRKSFSSSVTAVERLRYRTIVGITDERLIVVCGSSVGDEVAIIRLDAVEGLQMQTSGLISETTVITLHKSTAELTLPIPDDLDQDSVHETLVEDILEERVRRFRGLVEAHEMATSVSGCDAARIGQLAVDAGNQVDEWLFRYGLSSPTYQELESRLRTQQEKATRTGRLGKSETAEGGTSKTAEQAGRNTNTPLADRVKFQWNDDLEPSGNDNATAPDATADSDPTPAPSTETPDEMASEHAAQSDTISREELIDVLGEIYDETGRVPLADDVELRGRTVHEYVNEFGDFESAIAAAGIDKEEELLREILRVKRELGELPTTTQMDEHGRYSAGYIGLYFGSWGAALEAASELQPSTRGSEHDATAPEQQSVASSSTDSPSSQSTGSSSVGDTATDTTSPSERTVAETGDSNYRLNIPLETGWDAARDDGEASTEPSQNPPAEETTPSTTSGEPAESQTNQTDDSPTRDALIAELKRLDDGTNLYPYSNTLHSRSEYGVGTFLAEFDTWEDALTAAGINKRERLLTELRRVRDELGKLPTTTEMNDRGAITASTYADYFGSWSTAKTLVGTGSEDPAAGDADHPAAPTDSAEAERISRASDIPNNARITTPLVMQISRQVDEQSDDSAVTYRVRDIDGDEFLFKSWGNHNVEETWTPGRWYAISDARGTVWNDGYSRLVSTTTDLRGVELGEALPTPLSVSALPTMEPLTADEESNADEQSPTTTSDEAAPTDAVTAADGDDQQSETDGDDEDHDPLEEPDDPLVSGLMREYKNQEL